MVKKRVYTDIELVGLRAVALVIKFARVPQSQNEELLTEPRSEGYISLRNFARLYEDQITANTISRAERMGWNYTEKRAIVGLNKSYLDTIADRLPYPVVMLAQLPLGVYQDWDVTPISELAPIKLKTLLNNPGKLSAKLDSLKIPRPDFEWALQGYLFPATYEAIAELFRISTESLQRACLIELVKVAEKSLANNPPVGHSEGKMTEEEEMNAAFYDALTKYYRSLLKQQDYRLSRAGDRRLLAEKLGRGYMTSDSPIIARLVEIATTRSCNEDDYLDVCQIVIVLSKSLGSEERLTDVDDVVRKIDSMLESGSGGSSDSGTETTKRKKSKA